MQQTTKFPLRKKNSVFTVKGWLLESILFGHWSFWTYGSLKQEYLYKNPLIQTFYWLFYESCFLLIVSNCRPWHDALAIALACAITCTNQEKGGWQKRWKAHPNINLNRSSKIYFNWYNSINFKLILLILLFKS